MSILSTSPWRGTNQVLAVFRILAALIFVSSGTMVIFRYPHINFPIPPFDPRTQAGIGSLLQLIGGAAIALGLFTRPVAFILSGEMAVAYFQFHAPQSFFPTVNNGTPAVLYCFFFFYLVFAGPGSWSLDGLIARKRG